MKVCCATCCNFDPNLGGRHVALVRLVAGLTCPQCEHLYLAARISEPSTAAALASRAKDLAA